MRLHNKLEGIPHDIQLYPKTTNIIVSAPIAANGGVIIKDRLAPQMGKSLIIAEYLAILQENVESRNDHRDKHLKLHKQMSTTLTRLLKKVTTKSLLTT